MFQIQKVEAEFHSCVLEAAFQRELYTYNRRNSENKTVNNFPQNPAAITSEELHEGFSLIKSLKISQIAWRRPTGDMVNLKFFVFFLILLRTDKKRTD